MNNDKLLCVVTALDAAFDAAINIVLSRHTMSGQQFEALQKELTDRVREAEGIDTLIADFPYRPATFGAFQEAGSCAAEVAWRFIRTVEAAIQCSKVISLAQFRVEPGDTQSFETWARGLAVELEAHTLELSGWSVAAIRRDSQFLRHAIRAEFEEVCRQRDNATPLKRDIKRDISKNFTPYVDCLRHPEPEVQQAAVFLNVRGLNHGKTKALIEYFADHRSAKMTTAEAKSLIEKMKKYEQRGRVVSGT